jgi:SPP1 gp7 family putative phage head morphogenesis protein
MNPLDLVARSTKLQILLDRYKTITKPHMKEKLDESLSEVYKLLNDTKQPITRERLVLIMDKIEVIVNKAYSDMVSSLQLDQEEVSKLAYEYTSASMQSHLLDGAVGAVAYSDLSKNRLNIIMNEKNIISGAGDTLSNIVKNQSDHHVRKGRIIIATSVKNGDGIESITKKMRDLWDNEIRHNIDAVTKTVIFDANTKAQEVSYEQFNNIIAFDSISVLDNRTSLVCQALSGKRYKRKEKQTVRELINSVPNRPKRHYRCRSELVPVTEYTDEIRESEKVSSRVWDKDKKVNHRDGTRSTAFKSKDAETKFLKSNSTFDDFADSLSVEDLGTIVGKQKAKLLKDRKITLADIRRQDNITGNWSYLTIEEIKRKF